jgi:methyl-accepting chemotaxis protein
MGLVSHAMTTRQLSIGQRLWMHSALLLLLMALPVGAALLDASHSTIVALGTVALLVGVAAAFVVTRSVTVPLARAVQAARLIATGDLSRDIDTRDSRGAEELFGALTDMTDNLRRMALNIRASADVIGRATGEIAAGNHNLSQRTTEQASSLEETAATMEQMTSTVRRNAEHSRHAHELAGETSHIAVKGGEVVRDVAVTMDRISRSSKQIAEISGVIEGIAQQTNILSLNAAVEAARAGEGGRGFAVVADEVRALARRSAESAKQIKSLIDDSVSQVGQGARLAQEAGATIDQVVASVKKVSEAVDNIHAASREQSQGIEQVNQTIVQMDAVTQQNASLVDAAASSASALEEQALQLTGAIRTLRIEANDAAMAAQAFVRNAAAYLRRNGLERARAAFNDADGQFVQGDLYIVLYDLRGWCLAHGTNAALRGTDQIDQRDPDGKYVVRERVRLAQEHATFWQDYRHRNPVTGEVAVKSHYFERVDDLLVGCGIYK